MKDAFMLTIPHSGTRVVRDQIFKPFYAAGGILTVKHSFIDQQAAGQIPDGAVHIATMRHPGRVWKSWDNRGKFRNRRDPQRWLPVWQWMDDYLRDFNVTTIHVDRPDLRGHELDIVSERIGFKLPQDWVPYPASSETVLYEPTDDDMSQVDPYIMDVYRRTLCQAD